LPCPVKYFELVEIILKILLIVIIALYMPLKHAVSPYIIALVKEMLTVMYNIDFNELGNRIRAERRKQKLTQKKLAKAAQISNSFMGHIERGGRTLSIKTLANLANALNLSIEYIVCGEFHYQPAMIPSEIHEALNKMNDSQRKMFLAMMKTLADNTASSTA